MKAKKASLISEETKIKHGTFPVGPLLEYGNCTGSVLMGYSLCFEMQNKFLNELPHCKKREIKNPTAD